MASRNCIYQKSYKCPETSSESFKVFFFFFSNQISEDIIPKERKTLSDPLDLFGHLWYWKNFIVILISIFNINHDLLIML